MLTKEIKKNENDLSANISNIYCRLADPVKFKDGLASMPYERVLDMVQIYYVRVRIGGGDFLSVMVNNKIMESWRLSKEQLRDIAWCNTLRDNPATIKPLRQVLDELGVYTDEEERRVYLVSNESKYMGAVCIVYPGLLEKIWNIIKRDFYVLPSSVHECLVLPCDDTVSAARLRHIVKTINRTELKDKDVLSDSVYRYSRALRALVIDNA
jgi:hypothetical protein